MSQNSEVLAFEDGRYFIPGPGKTKSERVKNGYVTRDRFPDGFSLQGVVADGRVLIRMDQGEGKKPKFRFMNPAQNSANPKEEMRVFEKIGKDDKESVLQYKSLDFFHKLLGTPEPILGERVSDYYLHNAPFFATMAASASLGIPEASGSLSGEVSLAKRMLPHLVRAGKIEAIGAAADRVAAKIGGEGFDTSGSALGTVSTEAGRLVGSVGHAAPLPLAELGIAGAGGIPGALRDYIPNNSVLARELLDPKNAAFVKGMSKAGIPATRGQMTQNVAIKGLEESFSASRSSHPLIKALDELQNVATGGYVDRSLEPIEAGVRPPFTKSGNRTSSITVGEEIKRPIATLRDRAAKLLKEQREIEAFNASEQKRIDTANAVGKRKIDLSNAAKKKAVENQNLVIEAENRKRVMPGGKDFKDMPTTGAYAAAVARDRPRLIKEGVLKEPVTFMPEVHTPEVFTPKVFDEEKAAQLSTITKGLGSQPTVTAFLKKSAPEDIATAFIGKNPSEMQGYVDIIDGPLGKEMLTEAQRNKARSAVRLAYARNILGIPMGTGEPVVAGIQAKLGLDQQGVIDVMNGKFDSNKISPDLKKFLGKDKEGRNLLEFLVNLSQTERLHQYKPQFRSGMGIFAMKRAIARAVGGGIWGSTVFKPAEREWIDEVLTSKAAKKRWVDIPHATRIFDLSYALKKGFDAYKEGQDVKDSESERYAAPPPYYVPQPEPDPEEATQ